MELLKRGYLTTINMNFKILLLLFLFPVLIFGQKNTPRELRNEKLIQDIGDVAQFAGYSGVS